MIKSKYYYQQTHSSNENILNKKNDSIYTNYLTTYKKDYKTIKINHSLTNKYKNYINNTTENENISINNDKNNTINVIHKNENLVPFERKLRHLSESHEDDKKNHKFKNLTLKCSNSLGFIERERKKRQEKILSNCLINVTNQHPKFSTIDRKFFIKETDIRNPNRNNQNNFNEYSFHNNKLNKFLYKKHNITLYNKNSDQKKYNSQKEIFTKYKIKYRNSDNNNIKTIQNNEINNKISLLFNKSQNDNKSNFNSSTTISKNFSSNKSNEIEKNNNNYNSNYNFIKNSQFNTISHLKNSNLYKIKKIPNLNLKILKKLVYNNSKKD